MKHLFQVIILNIILITYIKTIVVLPLYKYQSKKEISNIFDFINNYLTNNIYTIIKIGHPSQDLELQIKDGESAFSVVSTNCHLETFYNRNISDTFKNTTSFESHYFVYDSCLAEETLNLYTDLGLKELKKIENIPFVYQREKKKMKNNKEIYNNCGVLSLDLFKENFIKNDYNFIFELKKLKIINDYSWTIQYIDNNDIMEGYLIIGDYPHNFDNKIYNSVNLRNTLNNLAEKGWNLNFKNITYNESKSLKHYMTGIISFDTNYIYGTEEYKSQISSFFMSYISKGICSEDSYSSHYSIYFCNSNQFKKNDIDNFPDLRFYHFEYNYNFTFKGSDLFMEKDGKIYFLIIFDKYKYRYWTFGKLFLKKYPLIFNHDSKMIGFYIDKNITEEPKEEKDYNNIKLLSIIFVLIIVAFIIGIIIAGIIFTKRKNKKAKELEDNDDFLNEKNEQKDDSESLEENLTIDTINNN